MPTHGFGERFVTDFVRCSINRESTTFKPRSQRFPFTMINVSTLRPTTKNELTLRRTSAHFLFSLTASMLVTGCQPNGEIREYVVPVENEKIFTSDLLKDQFGVIPFEWDAPKSWAVADNDQFSKIAWQVGPKGNEARITLSDLPIAAGLVPQLTRWRGQIGIELGSKDDPMAGSEVLKLGETSATFVDLKGTESTILGLLIPLENKLWIFKFRGNNQVADEHRERFRNFCESVRAH